MSEELYSTQPPYTKPVELEPQPNIWGAWASFGLGLAIVVLALIVSEALVQIGFLIAKMTANPQIDTTEYLENIPSNGLVLSLSSIASFVSGMGLIFLFVRLKGNNNFIDYLGLRLINWKIALYGFAFFLLAFFMDTAFAVFYKYLIGPSNNAENSSFMIDAYSSAGWLPLLWIAIAVLTPIFEESLFRGFLFAGLQRSQLGVAGAIIITSLTWALLHMQYNLFGMLSILLLGIVLGFARYKTGSLWTPIIVHILWNLVALLGTALSL